MGNLSNCPRTTSSQEGQATKDSRGGTPTASSDNTTETYHTAPEELPWDNDFERDSPWNLIDCNTGK
jgi:hypothetical protein